MRRAAATQSGAETSSRISVGMKSRSAAMASTSDEARRTDSTHGRCSSSIASPSRKRRTLLTIKIRIGILALPWPYERRSVDDGLAASWLTGGWCET